MLYVNNKSLREEFDDLKSEFKKLTIENTISKESRVLFSNSYSAFFAELEMLILSLKPC